MSTRPLILAGLALVGGCSPEAPRTPATPPVRTMVLTADEAADFRRFPGEVSATHNGRLSFDVGGRIIDFPVYDGMIVAAGQMLARLDPTDYRAQFDASAANFNNARAEFERASTLLERRVISRAEHDQRRQEFEVAEAALAAARKSLEDTQLFAPFPGRVAHRFVRNFQSVQARELVLLLQDISTLEVDVNLPETSMTLAGRNLSVAEARGMIDAKAGFAALPGREFPLTLESFATRANPASRTFPISFSFQPPDDAKILPGMTCTVFLRLRGDGAAPPAPDLFALPLTAVAKQDGATAVWKLDPATMRVARVPVESLGLVEDRMQVRAPALKPGDEIVTTGVRFLSEGMAVSRMAPARR